MNIYDNVIVVHNLRKVIKEHLSVKHNTSALTIYV